MPTATPRTAPSSSPRG
uniref:Uncharacterized protein n=1 Tax=Arundo donax TaxID=35708 RepID=A0A0A9FTS6_ARUDO